MKNKIYEITGRMKSDNETWEDFFERVNKEGGTDVKTLFKLIVVIFEELENAKNNTRENNRVEYTPDYGIGDDISTEDGEISSGIGITETEI